MKIIAGLEPNDMRVLNVELKDTDKVVVLHSGGMDSTLLLYMLLKDKQEKSLKTEIHVFTATQVGTKIHSINVLNLPEFKGKVKHYTDIDNPVPEGIRPIMNALLQQNCFFYTGANQVPLEQIGGRYPLRQDVGNPTNEQRSFPFWLMYKYHILDAYFKLGIEHIIKTTHTCTELVYGKCGECYACREKSWAFNKLGIEEKYYENVLTLNI